jgi:hypothetical protein
MITIGLYFLTYSKTFIKDLDLKFLRLCPSSMIRTSEGSIGGFAKVYISKEFLVFLRTFFQFLWLAFGDMILILPSVRFMAVVEAVMVLPKPVSSKIHAPLLFFIISKRRLIVFF